MEITSKGVYATLFVIMIVVISIASVYFEDSISINLQLPVHSILPIAIVSLLIIALWFMKYLFLQSNPEGFI
ncbi:MAG: hypothetical protein INQ03_15745 [Candidatus Heimdallarchaeota archaeon]|nr:hypothetical protein [Candidatus Heimdallarchaeota archaeon]